MGKVILIVCILTALVSGAIGYSWGVGAKAAAEERLSTLRTAAEQAVAVARSNQAVAETALQRLSECVNERQTADRRGENMLAQVLEQERQRAAELIARTAEREELYARDADADAFRRLSVPESIAATLRERPG